ncbi:MAG: hypothetical protein QXQ81_07775, partial [Candidatus Thorarchaeota archaeon]
MSEETANAPWLRPMIPVKTALLGNLVGAVAIILVVFFTYRGDFPFQSPLGLYRFLPGDILLDFVWLYVISVVIGIFLYIFTPLLAIVFWRVHRLAKGRSHNYYIQRYSEGQVASLSRRYMTPALTSMGLSFSLSGEATRNMIFVMENFEHLAEEDIAIVTAMPVLFIAILVSTVVMLIFAPLWLLEDAGLISEKRITGPRMTADVEGVGQFFTKYLRGFAGLSTVIGYLLLGVQTVLWYQIMLTRTELMLPAFVYLLPVTAVFAAPLIAQGPISAVSLFYEFG